MIPEWIWYVIGIFGILICLCLAIPLIGAIYCVVIFRIEEMKKQKVFKAPKGRWY